MIVATTAETFPKLLNFEETELNCFLLMHHGDGGLLRRCTRSKRSKKCLFCSQSISTAADLKPNTKREETILRYISPLLIFAFVDQSGPGYCMSSLIVRPKTWDSEEMAICFEGAWLMIKLRFVDLLFFVNFVFFRTDFFVTVYLSTFFCIFHAINGTGNWIWNATFVKVSMNDLAVEIRYDSPK